jgi:hypothetical protein
VDWSAHDTVTITNAVYPGNTAGTLDLSGFMSPDPVSRCGWLEDPLCPHAKTISPERLAWVECLLWVVTVTFIPTHDHV